LFFFLNSLFKKAISVTNTIAALLGIICVFGLIFNYGFEQNHDRIILLNQFFNYLLFSYFIIFYVHAVSSFALYKKIPKIIILLVSIFSGVTLLITLRNYDLHYRVFEPFFFLKTNTIYLHIQCLFFALYTFLTIDLSIKKSTLNPAQVFVTSFVLIVCSGTLLLLLPKATHQNISLIDALFTATSAVCVTGLIVVDTASHFTGLGKAIILLLIQIGGLGIMTFTVFFASYFKGNASFASQLMTKSFTKAQKLGEAIHVLKRIISITLIVECLGALALYLFMEDHLFKNTNESIFFSVFHSISAFCNAGFSSIPNGLFNEAFRTNYSFINSISF